MVMSLYHTLKSRTGTYRRRKSSDYVSLDPSISTSIVLAASSSTSHQQHLQQQHPLPVVASSSATLPTPVRHCVGTNVSGNGYGTMVSRRKILSRSRDDLNLEQHYQHQQQLQQQQQQQHQQHQQEDEEDVWYQKDKLYKEHIQEVLDKWTQIDDEIWAKVIVFERNRRVAKAYARAPVLTINGSDEGFDGMRIGLTGFDNPLRDSKTDELKKHVGQGVKIKMDDAGNILIRRYAKSNVFVKSTTCGPNDETAIGTDILKLPNQALESEKIVKIFDMKKFQSNVNRELRRAYPDRRRLETQCLSAIAFVKSEADILDCPIWVLIVNVVAMDMLKSKLPPVQRPLDIKNRPRIPIPDEDPYSVAGNGHNNVNSSTAGNGSAGHMAVTREHMLQMTQKRSEKPPKLPPRDKLYYPQDIPKPDYDDILEEDTRVSAFRGKSDKGKDLNKKYDDPYYCGLRARVPNFVQKSNNNNNNNNNVGARNGHNGNNSNNAGVMTKPRSGKESTVVAPTKRMSVASKAFAQQRPHHQHQPNHHQSMAAIHQLHQSAHPVPQYYSHHQHQHHLAYNTQYPLGSSVSTSQMQYAGGGAGRAEGLYGTRSGAHGYAAGGSAASRAAHSTHKIYHAKSYESGIDSEMVESPYNHIYGRIPLPTRGYIPTQRTMYIGEWD